MNEPNKIEPLEGPKKIKKMWLDALNMSLARMYVMPINFYLE